MAPRLVEIVLIMATVETSTVSDREIDSAGPIAKHNKRPTADICLASDTPRETSLPRRMFAKVPHNGIRRRRQAIQVLVLGCLHHHHRFITTIRETQHLACPSSLARQADDIKVLLVDIEALGFWLQDRDGDSSWLVRGAGACDAF